MSIGFAGEQKTTERNVAAVLFVARMLLLDTVGADVQEQAKGK